MKSVVLDTNAYRELLSGDQEIAKILLNAEEIIMPSVVIGELLEAFKLGNREEVNRAKLWQFTQEPGVVVVNLGIGTAEIYANIRIKLHKAGTPIPVNDVWIAAVAMEAGAKLITSDRYFGMIKGLGVGGLV